MIKYRQAIFEKGKIIKWHYWGFIEEHGNLTFVAPETNRSSIEEAYKNSYQCVGLRDKDGREIYNRDRVAKFDFEDPYFQSTVISQDGAFGYIAAGGSNFIPFALNYHFEWVDGQSQKIKIVGDIINNPELVGGTK